MQGVEFDEYGRPIVGIVNFNPTCALSRKAKPGPTIVPAPRACPHLRFLYCAQITNSPTSLRMRAPWAPSFMRSRTQWGSGATASRIWWTRSWRSERVACTRLPAARHSLPHHVYDRPHAASALLGCKSACSKHVGRAGGWASARPAPPTNDPRCNPGLTATPSSAPRSRTTVAPAPRAVTGSGASGTTSS